MAQPNCYWTQVEGRQNTVNKFYLTTGNLETRIEGPFAPNYRYPASSQTSMIEVSFANPGLYTWTVINRDGRWNATISIVATAQD